MSLLIAVVLALVSAVAYAAGAVVQQRLAAGTARGGGWLLAVGLNAAGGGLHVLALRYGPLALIQPLGALTLVLALPASAACAGRRVTSIEWRGAALTMAGLAGLLLLTRTDGGARALSGAELVVVLIVSALALAGLGTVALTARRPVPRSIWFSIASGVAFGVSSALTQTIAVRLSDGALLDAGVIGAGVAVGLLASAGLLLAQAAYRAGLGAQLATSTLANAATAAAIGLAVLGEHYAAGTTGAMLALGAAALAGRGVLLLSGPAEPGPTVTRRERLAGPPSAVAEARRPDRPAAAAVVGG